MRVPLVALFTASVRDCEVVESQNLGLEKSFVDSVPSFMMQRAEAGGGYS